MLPTVLRVKRTSVLFNKCLGGDSHSTEDSECMYAATSMPPKIHRIVLVGKPASKFVPTRLTKVPPWRLPLLGISALKVATLWYAKSASPEKSTPLRDTWTATDLLIAVEAIPGDVQRREVLETNFAIVSFALSLFV